MTCRICHAENSDGRERCIMCGQTLLDLNNIMERDRWSGFAVKGGVIGVFVGAPVGAFVGLLLGAIFDRQDPVAGAIGAAWVGCWLGIPVGGMIGAGVGILSRVGRRI